MGGIGPESRPVSPVDSPSTTPETYHKVSIKVDANNDKLDEITSKKPEVLKHLKQKYSTLENEVFSISQSKLNELQQAIDDNNYNKIDEIMISKLIKDNVIDENNQKKQPSLDTLIIGTKDEKVKQMAAVIGAGIDEKLKAFPSLTHDQKQNIHIGIACSIINSGVLEEAFAGVGNFVNGVAKGLIDLLGDLMSGKLTGGKKDAKDYSDLERFTTILDTSLTPLISLLNKNKNDLTKINGFLSNPEAIEKYKEGDDVSTIKEMEPEKLVEYLTKNNSNIRELEKKLEGLKDFKENIIEKIANYSGMQSTILTKGLDILLGIPLLGDLIAIFLGYKNKEEAQEGIGEELKMATATKFLKGFGGFYNEKGAFQEAKNNNIDLLKDKDLTSVKYSQLKTFYGMCKKAGIEYTENDFWIKLINGGSTDPKMKALNNNYKSLDIKDSDFESKKPKASFFEKLNKLTTETPETTTTATATAAAESQTKAVETENINYTKLIEGSIIDNHIATKLSAIKWSDFQTNSYKEKASKILGENNKKSEIISVLDAYAKLIQDLIKPENQKKFNNFKAGLKNLAGDPLTLENDLSFFRLFGNRNHLCLMFKEPAQTTTPSAAISSTQQAATTPEKKNNTEIDLLNTAIDAKTSGKLSEGIILGNNKTLKYNPATQQIEIGTDKYSVNLKKGILPIKISDFEFQTDNTIKMDLGVFNGEANGKNIFEKNKFKEIVQKVLTQKSYNDTSGDVTLNIQKMG